MKEPKPVNPPKPPKCKECGLFQGFAGMHTRTCQCPEPTSQKMITVYKVEHEGSYCILFHIQDALDLMKAEIEDNYSEEDHPLEFNLTIGEMSQEDIDNLGEFEGF